MNKQEKFNKVVNHLLIQKTTAKENGMCRYKTKDGLKCAFGALIPEGHNAEYLIASIKQLMGLYPDINDIVGQDYDLLRELQEIHDWIHPGRWMKELAYTAKAHGLKFEPPVAAAQ